MQTELARVLSEHLTQEGLQRIASKGNFIVGFEEDAQFFWLNRLRDQPPMQWWSFKKSKTKAVRVGKKIARKSQPNYVARVLKEIHIFFCTDDKKYANLRKQMQSITKGKSQTVIINTLSLGIAPYVGTAAAVIMPFVAFVCLFFLEVGIEAWCEGKR